MRKSRKIRARIQRRDWKGQRSIRSHLLVVFAQRAGLSLQGAPPELCLAIETAGRRVARALVAGQIDGDTAGVQRHFQSILAWLLREQLAAQNGGGDA